MIDLARVKSLLDEAAGIIADLHGIDFADPEAWSNKAPGYIRSEKAQTSQQLQLLATRFELAAALVRVEFWHVKGAAADPFNPDRRD